MPTKVLEKSITCNMVFFERLLRILSAAPLTINQKKSLEYLPMSEKMRIFVL